MRVLAAVFLACVSAFAQQPSPDGTYRVGNGVTPPKVISKTDPEYAEEARLAKLNGSVLLSLIVGEDGKPRNIRVVRPLGLGLDEKAIEAVNTWQFSPGMKDGMPVPVNASIQVNFRLLGGPWSLSRAVFNTPESAARPVLIKASYLPPDQVTGENGTATVSFNVDQGGSPANLHIEKSSSPEMESEVIAILPGWQFRPATQNGQFVTVQGTFDFVKGKPAPPPPSSLPPPRAGIQRMQVAPKDQEVLLVSAAMEAVRQSTYRPTLVNGTPVEVVTDISVEFKLDDAPQ
jgi:TonB family protein